MHSYTEGHHVKREFVKHLRHLRREHHGKYCEAGNGTSTPPDVAPAMASVLGNTAREVEVEAKVDIKIVEWGVEEKVKVTMVRGYEWT
jgi:hypothetical protein